MNVPSRLPNVISDLTICTITLANDHELLETLESIQEQKVWPYMVIVKDGQVRKPPELLDRFSFQILHISETDKGIYDAMNQALAHVQTDYIVYLNSGDRLYSTLSLSCCDDALSCNAIFDCSADVLLFPWHRNDSVRKYFPSLNALQLNHQATIYKAKMHRQLGPYLAMNGFTAADYLFFYMAFANGFKFRIIEGEPLVMIDPSGASSSLRTPLLVASINYFGGTASRLKLLAVCLLHPLYYVAKSFLCRFAR
jgi:glycosyltransferase involved in cell wall biosynthesis